MLAGLLAGTGCNLFGGGSPISGPPEVPWTTRADIDVDVNGDGLADVVMAGVDGIVSDCPMPAGCVSVMRVWYGNEDFLFEPGGQDEHVEDVFSAIWATGDINGDGYTDVWGGGEVVGVALGGPSGLDLANVVQNTGLYPEWRAGDINCDGYSDFGTTSGVVYGGEDVAQALADGASRTGDHFEAFPPGAGATWVPRPVGDVNADGCDDLIVAGELIWGSATGMSPSGIYLSTNGVPHFGPNDVNGDGVDDVVAYGGEIWLGDPSGNLTGFFPEEQWFLKDVRDITGDGIADQLEASTSLSPLSGPNDVTFTRFGLAEQFGLAIYRGGHESWSISDEEVEAWSSQTADEQVLDDTIEAGTLSDFSYQIYWGRGDGSIGDFDGDGYRDYVVRSDNYGFLYRGGDRLDRRDNMADGIVLNPSHGAAIAGIALE